MGIFDLATVVYYLSICAFFIYLVALITESAVMHKGGAEMKKNNSKLKAAARGRPRGTAAYRSGTSASLSSPRSLACGWT